MNFWSAMVAIVAIVAFSAMRIARYHAGLGDPPSRLRGVVSETLPPVRETELRREIDKLHQRVAVLERGRLRVVCNLEPDEAEVRLTAEPRELLLTNAHPRIAGAVVVVPGECFAVLRM